ncbi:MAG: DUF3365 domain-containing protein [Ignavibacteria bacterium]|nr:DUF3365 domain-containing protein [Ignavibacteria bacterium]
MKKTADTLQADEDIQELRGARGWFLRMLQRHPILILGLLLFTGMAMILWHLNRFSTSIKESVSLQSAEQYAATLSEFRLFYANEIIPRLKTYNVDITPEYLLKSNAIPIPATMSIDLSKRISARGGGYLIRVYSDFPFPWRAEEGGPRDDFEREALKQLRGNAKVPYARFEVYDGRTSLRYTSPMLMERSCVTCHNTHPASPKKDWKVGDVRGVQEITMPLDRQIGEIKTGLTESFSIMMIITVFGLGILWVAVGGLRKSLAHTQLLAERQKDINRELEIQVSERTRAELALEETNRTLESKVEERTHELSEKNGQLSEAMDRLKETQEQLIVQEKLASLGELTAAISHEIKNPLNFVNNFAKLSRKLTAELREELAQHPDGIPTADLPNLTDIASDLTENLARISEHGERADSIVKGMLLHSRGISEPHKPTDINALVKESANLAYHGMRAQSPDFEFVLNEDFAPDLPPVLTSEQDLGRVFLNILNNGLYAIKQKKEQRGDTYAAEIRITTRLDDDAVEIRLRDNGTGIPAELREKIFQPFFTTKPSGQGTGLGLSISYEVVKQHEGTFRVESEAGEFTEFIVRLPLVRT